MAERAQEATNTEETVLPNLAGMSKIVLYTIECALNRPAAEGMLVFDLHRGNSPSKPCRYGQDCSIHSYECALNRPAAKGMLVDLHSQSEFLPYVVPARNC